jgi:acyl transferase domain-containing protein
MHRRGGTGRGEAARALHALAGRAGRAVGGTPQALIGKLEKLVATLGRHEGTPLAAIAASLADADRAEPVRLALVAKDAKSLGKRAEQALGRLRDKPAPAWSLRSGAFFGSAPVAGKLAFLFPGEGSQYTHMLADLALCFDEVRQWLDFWHSLYDHARGDNRTDVAFPHASENDEESSKRLDARLHDMDVGSEAVFVAGMAMQSVLRSLGVEPDAMMGHSSGESAALAASGRGPGDHAARARRVRARAQRRLRTGAGRRKDPTGALLAVGALPAEAVQAQIARTGSPVVIAMDNCANQLVLLRSEGGCRRTAGRARRRRRDLPAAAVRSRLPHRRLRRRERRVPGLLRPDQAAGPRFRSIPAPRPGLSRARPRPFASSPRRSGRRRCAFARRSSRWWPMASAASSKSGRRAT